MDITSFDDDDVLTDYLTDYLDGNLDATEVEVFEEYLDQNKREKEFTCKARKGKQALNWLVKQMNNYENIEYKLATQIALEKLRSGKSDTINQ
ncbi:hypothetical protein ACG2F4_15990 [Halalkalibaculum sp. DA3122]|uniref:hypothetical protein n=1 Tax=unclassified Halalkalibaculum TaxID=2964617 RepID=UPI003754B695